MNDWVRVNWKPITSILSLGALYALAKWFPGLEQERELVEAFTEVLGLGLIALVPGLRKTRRVDDPRTGTPPAITEEKSK